jgi:hypothetical protein
LFLGLLDGVDARSLTFVRLLVALGLDLVQAGTDNTTLVLYVTARALLGGYTLVGVLYRRDESVNRKDPMA